MTERKPNLRSVREVTPALEFRTVHGYRRAYRVAGSGPAILLIHGIGDNSTTWAISITGVIISAVVIAFFWMRRPAQVAVRNRESLMDEIVLLDDAYQAGEMTTGRYQLKREQLKSELRQWYED